MELKWKAQRWGRLPSKKDFGRVTHLLYQRRGVGARSAPRRAATHASLCVHSVIHCLLQSFANAKRRRAPLIVKGGFLVYL